MGASFAGYVPKQKTVDKREAENIVLIALEEQILFASFAKSGYIIFSQQYDEVNRERELMRQIRIQIFFPLLLMMENSPENHSKFMASTHAGTSPTKLALKQMGTHAVPGW